MIARIKSWWRTRQAIKLGLVEVEKFNGELSECRGILVSIADEEISKLKDSLNSLKGDENFGIELCRETWQDWHSDGEELVEITREAVHQRMAPHLDFAEVLQIEAEMNGIVNKSVDEFKAHFLLGGANAYAQFAIEHGLVPDETEVSSES